MHERLFACEYHTDRKLIFSVNMVISHVKQSIKGQIYPHTGERLNTYNELNIASLYVMRL